MIEDTPSWEAIIVFLKKLKIVRGRLSLILGEMKKIRCLSI